MIFLTVGTTKFPFNRILKTMDKVMVNLGEREKLVVQKGVSDYQFKYKNALIFKDISFKKIVSYLKKARVVITHGGPSTIFLSLKYGKNKPLVIPRRKKNAEQVNDHQVYFARFLKKKNSIKAISPTENLAEKMTEYIKFPKKLSFKKGAPATRRLIEKLIKYTESIK